MKPFYVLGVEAEVQNQVGTEIYGMYAALISLSFMLNMIPDMGITNWNNREVALNHRLSAIFGNILRLRFSLAILYLIFSVSIGFILGYNKQQIGWLAILGVNQILAQSILFFRSNLSGMHLFKKDSFISILDRTLLIIGMSYLLWAPHGFGKFHIEWFIIGQTVAYLITISLAAFWVIRLKSKAETKPSNNQVKHIITASLPFAAFSLLGMLLYRTDAVLLERISSPAEAGTYTQGFRFFEAFNMLSFLFAGLLLPIFSRMIAMKEDISDLLNISHRLLFAATFIVSVTCIFLSEQILNLVYDHVNQTSVESFKWLMVGCLGFSMQYIYGTLLTAAGELRKLTIITIIGLAISLTINFTFIPSQGALASAKASAITQILVWIIQTFYCLRIFKINVFNQFKESILFAILVVSTGYFLFEINSDFTIKGLGFTLSVGLFLGLTLIIALGTRMLSFKNFIQLLKLKS
ncbi:MAG: oligosaccharide flippase family protein [Flavobacteriales bacterium]